MDHLRRSLAPISEEAWEAIDTEARSTLRHYLAARPLVDFTGPLGWRHATVPLGRVSTAAGPVEGVTAGVRTSQPLVELRTPFTLSISELDALDRGAPDADLDPLIEAARLAALAEDQAIFKGYEPGGITGMAPASPHEPLLLSDDYDDYPGAVARAVARLRQSGVEGPYGIALGPRCYTGVIETTHHGGYPVFEHVKMILGGPLIWAPAVDGAIVVSMRGGDFELVCGQDLSVGYLSHTADEVQLYIEESLTFVVRDERAAIALRYER